MSKKILVEIAAQFASAYKLALDDSERRAIRDCAERMAQVARNNNPRFDTDRFMAACGF